MPSTFTDDLKHMVKDAASGARDRLTAIQGGVQPTLGKMRALPAATKKKIAVAGVAVAVLGLGLALRGGKSPRSERIADGPSLRGSSLSDVQNEAPRPPARFAQRSYAVGKAEEKHGEYKAAAESYLVAARKGDARGLKKLVDDPRAQVRGTLRGGRRTRHHAQQEGHSGAEEAGAVAVQG